MAPADAIQRLGGARTRSTADGLCRRASQEEDSLIEASAAREALQSGSAQEVGAAQLSSRDPGSTPTAEVRFLVASFWMMVSYLGEGTQGWVVDEIVSGVDTRVV
ncbi:formin-like protein 5 [Iris pallida]|uniref:Formin-like protein 5 n=1 Tax=Iris pallida TaxID=29817 RepID=A0AAX6DQ88_IRIPA|nr:formin-like protein 5 [Iris pallida]